MITKIKKNLLAKSWRKDKLQTLLVRMEINPALWGTVCRDLRVMKGKQIYDPITQLLDAHQMKPELHRGVCTHMAIEASFTTAKQSRQPARPSSCA